MNRILLLCFLIYASMASIVQTCFAKTIQVKGANIDSKYEGKAVKLQYYQNYYATSEWPPVFDTIAKINRGKFEFEIHPTENLGYILIWMPGELEKSLIGRYLLVEAGDNIFIDFSGDSVVFRGKNGSKFSVQYELFGLERNRITTKNDIDSDYISKSFLLSDSYVELKIKKLNIIKDAISPEVYQILKLNIEANDWYYRNQLLYALSAFQDNPVSRANIKKYYNEHIRGGIPFNYPLTVKLKSSNYIEYLLQSELCDQYFADHHPEAPLNMIHFDSLFNNILRKYEGDIRDRLLMTITTCWISSRENTDFYRNKAIEIVQDPFSREVLIENNRIFGRGAKALDFSLEDTSGKIVNLHDFKGKVVILDFYFTGCSGCISLAHGMSPVSGKYKSNSDVVFISINVDQTKEMFKSAVASGKYSHPGYINLWTNGQGIDHDLIKYYRMTGFPVLLIIDRSGNILSADPPFPSTNKPNSTNQFVNIIETGLAI